MNRIYTILVLFIIVSCNSKKHELENFTSEFEQVNTFIIENYSNANSNILDNLQVKFKAIKRAKKESNLSEIISYNEKGISYKFERLDKNDNYYLLKVLNGKTELLDYEQFVDYSKRPIKLRNSWYLIEQNEYD